MCGRFSLYMTPEQIRQHFSVDVVTCEWKPRPEVFPSQQVPTIIMHQSKTRLGLLNWGLIPSWAKEKKGAGHINSFLKRRCLILADEYYEWKTDPENDNRKIRYCIQLPSREPFAFAGLWDTWQKDYSGCTIITREATGEIKDIHDRMPCVLKPEAHADWLDPFHQDVHGLRESLQNGCVDDFIFSPR